MKKYKVNIRPTAQNDLEQRYLDISEDSPENAINCYFDITDAIQKLDTLALRCPLAPEDADIQIGIRHLNIGNYRVLYFIDNNAVKIIHVRGASHDRKL